MVLVATACAPSDPSPPLQFTYVSGAMTVMVDRDEEPNAKLVLLEVIINSSPVLSDSDERIWRASRNSGSAVDEVVLGQTPPGWEEGVPWRPPAPDSLLTVLVELTDGRKLLIDGQYG